MADKRIIESCEVRRERFDRHFERINRLPWLQEKWGFFPRWLYITLALATALLWLLVYIM